MKLHALIIACTASLFASPAYADARISFDFFQESLSPYGDWNETDQYGLVWQPSGVDRDWSPYTDGYWSYTDAGWTWVSYEDFGGITYHYGRWVQLDAAGWCWVPGYDWGPAWVSWRRSDDYVGWAPLPPEARWEVSVGISSWSDTHYNVGPGWYSFCQSRDFGAPVIRHVVVPRSRNVTIINVTNNITNITYNHDRGYVFNGGLDYDYIAPRCSRSLPSLKLVQETNNIFINGNRGNVFINTQRGNTLFVAAPQRAESNWNVITKKPVIRNVYKAPAVSRGWAGLDKDGVREKLLVKMRGEVNGATPENAPARAFRPESIAHVPKKTDSVLPRPSLLKATANRDDHDKDDGPSILKKPISRPSAPMDDTADKDNDRPSRPSTLKQPAIRPEISSNQDREDSTKIGKTPAVRPEAPNPSTLKKQRDDDHSDDTPKRPQVITRPSDDGGLRKKLADQQDRDNSDAERARAAAISREKAERDIVQQRDSEQQRKKQSDSQRAEESARSKQAEAQSRSAEIEKMQHKQSEAQSRSAEIEKMQRKQSEAQSRSAEIEKMQRKQADSQRAAEENARRQQSVEKQRRSEQDNARRAHEENARRASAADAQRRAEMSQRSADEARQRQAAAMRQQQAEAAMRKQATIQRPQSSTPPSSSRTLTPEQQEELLKKKKSR